MKTINFCEDVPVPEGVSIEVANKVVKVKCERGALEKDFSYSEVEINLLEDKKVVRVELWLGTRKLNECVYTIAKHIKNMINGVLYGFEYQIRSVYAHFPINLNIIENNKVLEIRNFLGEKHVRKIKMLEGAEVHFTGNKDEIKVVGNDIMSVSMSAASIQESVRVKGKDIRKFLDGMYVSERGFCVKVE